ncbi:MAG: iron-containing alcohol dehydrogenase family protein [Spirochaetia bacterium]|nr:iron-containing alcohol dehydrogenase family protein [Spirochaetota bacterium]MCX8097245.1 iron-containing alcohol dehydrogenase family protein [Spirochaetota bacterium]MDW8111853.1 iron-containing alcohol dehydrogenase family protein [Spirochaetia bacterium]
MNKFLTPREISIPYVLKIYKGLKDEVGEVLKNIGVSSVVIFYGEGIQKMFGSYIEKSIKDNGISMIEILEGRSNKIEDIYDIAFKIKQSDVILGIGGGKVIDIAKYVGYIRKIPVITFPTAPSNDSICSPLCSLMVDGRRTTVPAKIPFGVIADTNILSSAPESFIYSGIGDIISKISALYDLDFEEKHKKINHDDFARMVAEKSIDSLLYYNTDNIRDEEFLGKLIDSLIMSGIAMEIEGDSAPASGSEHLISHALDKILPNPHLHGIQVGVATYIMVNVQENPRRNIAIDILSNTGFWEFAKKENFNLNAWLLAVDNAPSIKPYRFTTIHDEKYRKKAKEFIQSDTMLKEVFSI